MSIPERLDRNKFRVIRICLGLMLLVSIGTLFTAYFDTDFYFLDYASGYFYGLVGTVSAIVLRLIKGL